MSEFSVSTKLEIMFVANVKLMEINKQLVETLEWIENKAHTQIVHGNEETDWKGAMGLIEGNARVVLDGARAYIQKETGDQS